MDVGESEIISLKFQCGEKIFDPVRCKSKQFYELLIAKKTMVSRGFTKLKEDFDLDDVFVSKGFLFATICAKKLLDAWRISFLSSK